jgi:hypothetical protein
VKRTATEAEIRVKDMQALIGALGLVDAEALWPPPRATGSVTPNGVGRVCLHGFAIAGSGKSDEHCHAACFSAKLRGWSLMRVPSGSKTQG